MLKGGSLAAPEEAARRRDDRRGVDAEMPVEVVDSAGLAEMFDAERGGAMAADAAEPAECRRVTVDGGDEPRVAWQIGQQRLDVTGCRRIALAAGALGG